MRRFVTRRVLTCSSRGVRSELVCPKCGNVSVTFDPFNNITVQLPQSNSVTVSVTFHALDPLTPPAKVRADRCRPTLCYAMSGTELAYAASICYVMPGTELAYAATRSTWSSRARTPCPTSRSRPLQ
eukprot:2383661-Rhodomonas_salina.2